MKPAILALAIAATMSSAALEAGPPASWRDGPPPAQAYLTREEARDYERDQLDRRQEMERDTLRMRQKAERRARGLDD